MRDPGEPQIRDQRFDAEEDGAVTVDWVVLTAAVVLLGAGAAFYATSTVPDLANAISDTLTGMDVVPD